MRASLIVPAALLSQLICAQNPTGTYTSAPGQSAAWRINEHHTLFWNGSPYIPAGVVIDGNVAAVEAAAKAGVKDVLVDLPAAGAGWSEVFEALNRNGMRFLIRINSLTPMAPGIAVEPQGYRTVGLTTAAQVSYDIPGATSALAVMASRRDASVSRHERVPVSGGKFSYNAPEIDGLEHVLLVYPETTSLEQPDFWEGLDAHRDTVLASLKRNPPGPGLRGIVNPLGRLLRMPGRQARFVPSSQAFRDELRQHLEIKYRNLDTATRAWTIAAPDFEKLDDLARLVPLWFGARGVAKLWDPASDRLYDVDQRRSAIWRDLTESILYAATRRFKRLTSAIRAVADVPVVQEWAGWAAPYHGGTVTFDGLGIRASGARDSQVVDSAAMPVAAMMRWSRPGWLIVSDWDLGPAPDLGAMPRALETLADLGARGVFARASTPELLKPLATLNGSLADSSLAETSPTALFFPENATNPAFPQRLPGGRWWLPLPEAGDRIDLGSQYAAYRMLSGDQSFIALWSRSGTKKTLLHMLAPQKAVFETLDGSDPRPKVVKNGVQITITDVPLIIKGTEEIPVPKEALAETIAAFQATLGEGRAGSGTANEQIFYFSQAQAGFNRNPGGAFAVMRAQYAALRKKLAAISWVEAESTKDTNFGEILSDPSASGQAALVLDTSMPSPSSGYYAEFELPVRTTAVQEAWIAARLPEEHRRALTVMVGGQAMAVEGEGVGRYGSGYSWYRLGTTRLSGGQMGVRVRLDAPAGADLAIDAIVLAPGTFKPDGVNMPETPIPQKGKG